MQGDPVVAQWLTNPTRNHEVSVANPTSIHEDADLIPGLTQ